jgi:hypothetical protein
VKNFLLLCSLILIVSSCSPDKPLDPDVLNNESNIPSVPPGVDPDVVAGHTGQGSTPIGPEYPIKDPKKVFTVSIKDTNYLDYQKEKLKKAEIVIGKIINSEEFKERVLSFKYNGKISFVDNDNLSNSQTYEKLFAGAEALQPAINYQMDLSVTMYKDSSTTIGYTYPNVLKVYTNKKYHDKYGPCEVAGNLVHEWTHKMGFGHASKYSTSRDYSVPYGVGYLVLELCPKYL